jgi:hypothetical protein
MVQPARAFLRELSRRHLEALRIGTRLTTYFREEREPTAVDVRPADVIQVLHGAGIRCVLMGTHALSTYREQARATQDVDILVPKKDVPRAIRALSKAFTTLELKDSKVLARFIDPVTEKVVIDLMKPAQKVYQMVFRQALPVGATHRIPNLEMALVSKFAAFTSPRRERVRKMQDVTDFAAALQHNRDRVGVGEACKIGAASIPGRRPRDQETNGRRPYRSSNSNVTCQRRGD